MQKMVCKPLFVAGLVAVAAVAGQDAIASSLGALRWQSVIGILQGNNVVGSGSGAVTGAPGPWSALNGHVNVDMQRSEIDFDVRGLVLAAGNSIGTPGTVSQIKGTLVCDTDGSAS